MDHLNNKTKSQQSAEKERTLQYLDIAGVIIVALDEEGNITLINEKGEEILGYKRRELLGKNWFDTCLPERMRKNVKAVFKQLIAGKIEAVEFYENPIVNKKGEERIIAWHNSVIRNEQGKIIGILSSGEDITERKQVEEKLREREQFITDIFESIQDGISVLNPDLTVRHVNNVMNQWYKENLPLEGKKCYEVYHNADKPCDPCPSLRCLESGKT